MISDIHERRLAEAAAELDQIAAARPRRRALQRDARGDRSTR